jgi:probable rRNA maturation factor
MVSAFAIKNTTKGTVPRTVPFQAMKEAVLGKKYDLSLVFVSEKKMRVLNKAHRGKDKTTNILSFPLDKQSGEVFICQAKARRENSLFGRPYNNYLAFLFIHGLIHLKGFDHGSRMEREERKFRKKFSI